MTPTTSGKPPTPSTVRASTEKRKSLQFPMIPPLPSSLNLDAENQRQAVNNRFSREAASPLTKETAGSVRSAGTATSSTGSATFGGGISLNSRSPHPRSPSVFAVTSTASSRLARRVLRYGETMESLFALDKDSTDDHWKLARSIADGSLADDVKAWRRMLHLVTAKVPEKNTVAGSNLVRLHRRATSRFALDTKENPTDVLALYLSFAKAQALYASEKDARMTFRHVQNQRGSETEAAFFIALADLEIHFGNHPAAKQAIQLGVQKQAQPLQALTSALSKLERNNNLQREKSAVRVSSATTYQSPRKRTLEQDGSPKRQKTPAGSSAEITMMPDASTARLQLQQQQSHSEAHSIRFQLAPQQRPTMNEDFFIPVAAAKHAAKTDVSSNGRIATGVEMIGKADDKPAALPRVARMSTSPLRQSAVKATRTQSCMGDAANRAKRPPLVSKTPRLARVGLSGKARRADPDQSVDIENDSDSETESTLPTGTKEKLVSKSKPAASIKKKMDLSYMMDWDPTARRGSATKPNTAISAVKPALGKIDEATPSLSSSTGSTESAGAPTGTASRSLSNHFNERKSMPTSLEGPDAGTPARPVQETPQRHDSTSEIAGLVARSNRDFLPLVSEKNMLRVNGVPYAKLGVIGKGGSCKVYRALSKDCSVLAIKKIKLEGMDKKAIDGYANEIALLKKLRGNPAIIQMFDSEVDLARKAIFVSMEVGEVDLNHVLQQQNLLRDPSTGDERRNLNMNFIRLTWQQMLGAVHCIHEERIIHGDLKPANFLFVRGALKLIDFGIAKAIQNDDTTNIYRESQIGTLNYMSPEAILDTGTGHNKARMKMGRASDIWSLGCILYQMVYGRTPFAELHFIQKLSAIVNPDHAIQYPGNADEGAMDVMQQCLRRNPDDRPPIIGANGLLNEHSFLNSRPGSQR